MKKLIAIPLLVLYLVAISGMMVQLHFCGDRLSSWNINKAHVACCCGDASANTQASKSRVAEAGTKNCCSDKVITLKIAQDQFRAGDIQAQLTALQLVPALALPAFFAVDVRPLPHERPVYRANAPPGPWQHIPLYKLHSRFTYYG